jgi:hypothetical protein
MRATVFYLLIAIFIWWIVAASGQTGPSANERALGTELAQTLQNKLACSAALITAQEEIAKLKAELAAHDRPQPDSPK